MNLYNLKVGSIVAEIPILSLETETSYLIVVENTEEHILFKPWSICENKVGSNYKFNKKQPALEYAFHSMFFREVTPDEIARLMFDRDMEELLDENT